MSRTSLSTVIRIENGEDSKFSNYIKVLSALELLENINILIPEPQPSFKALYEGIPKRKRVRKSKKRIAKWVWGEDLEKKEVEEIKNNPDHYKSYSDVDEMMGELFADV